MLEQLKNIVSTIWQMDLRISRFSIAAGSLLWFLFLFAEGNTFDRQVYHIMAEFADEEVWASMVAVHGLLLMASAFRPNDFPAWFKACINSFGCALWTATHASMMIYPYPAAIAPGLVLTFLSWWVLVKTPLTSKTRRITDRL